MAESQNPSGRDYGAQIEINEKGCFDLKSNIRYLDLLSYSFRLVSWIVSYMYCSIALDML